MGMPITLEVSHASVEDMEKIFDFFHAVDTRFSPFKIESELSKINRGEIAPRQMSLEMQEILALAEKTKKETDGYFNIKKPSGEIDPSGVVKGWAIKKAADTLKEMGFEHFYVDAGGDIQTSGRNHEEKSWSVGIKNPFQQEEIVKVIYPEGKGVATSGSYIRGSHIYNPHSAEDALGEVLSITVIAEDVLEADRFATAAFAMGKKGITFIETLPGFEGYAIDKHGMATMTSGFHRYTMSQ